MAYKTIPMNYSSLSGLSDDDHVTYMMSDKRKKTAKDIKKLFENWGMNSYFIVPDGWNNFTEEKPKVQPHTDYMPVDEYYETYGDFHLPEFGKKKVLPAKVETPHLRCANCGTKAQDWQHFCMECGGNL